MHVYIYRHYKDYYYLWTDEKWWRLNDSSWSLCVYHSLFVVFSYRLHSTSSSASYQAIKITVNIVINSIQFIYFISIYTYLYINMFWEIIFIYYLIFYTCICLAISWWNIFNFTLNIIKSMRKICAKYSSQISSTVCRIGN